MITAKEALKRTTLSSENTRKRFYRSIEEKIKEAADKGRNYIISCCFVMEQDKITYIPGYGETGEWPIVEVLKDFENWGYTIIYETNPYESGYYLCIEW